MLWRLNEIIDGKCLKQHFANVKDSVNVAIIILGKKTFELSKTFKNFYIFRDKMETYNLDYGVSSGWIYGPKNKIHTN